MKCSLLLALISVPISALAASVPSTLPDGKYAMECQMITVEKFDPPAAGSNNPYPKGTDANGMSRRVQSEKGTTVFVSAGDSVTIKDTYTLTGEDYSIDAVDVTQATIKSVDNNFEESATVTSTDTYKGEGIDQGQTSTASSTWSRTFAVEGNFEINLKAKDGDDPEAPGRSETLVTKNEDGSYSMVSYIREGYHQDAKTLKGGATTLGGYIYQSDSICNYTPTK